MIRGEIIDTEKRLNVRLSGNGGQGLLLAGLLLAEACGIYEGHNVVQTNSYGPEARGGASRSEVVISDGPIDYPHADNLDILLSLSQESCDKYFKNLKHDGLFIVDNSQVEVIPTTRAVEIPIMELAKKEVGKTIVANVVALGVIAGVTNLVSLESLKSAVLARAPQGSEDLNTTALLVGYKEGVEYKKKYKIKDYNLNTLKNEEVQKEVS